MARSRKGWSRREALRGAAAVAAVGCGTREGSEAKKGDSAAPAAGQIDTVILIMFENRSFDHWLGGRALVEGRAEDGLTSAMSNLDTSGVAVTPFPLDNPCLDDPSHSWNGSHTQWNEGACDSFVTVHAASSGTDGHDVMGYLQRADVPVSWALADGYTVCDRWFCSVMGPTWPNRIYGHAGSNLGVKGNDFVDAYPYTNPTIWNKLDEIGVSWTYYYGDVPFIAVFEHGYDSATCKMVEDLTFDAANGLLPPVVWIDPAFTYNDNHPPKHHALGEVFLADIYRILSKSPQWERMLIVVTYDEHGGFFDHVNPPTTDDDYAADGFDQLGFRVPALLIGPWVKQGVCSTTFDHSSWLKFLCDTHGIEPWTKRIAAAASIGEALDLDRMASGVPLDPVELAEFSFDEEDLPEECDGGNDVISAALQQLARLALERGFPVRLDRRAIASAMRSLGRPRVG